MLFQRHFAAYCEDDEIITIKIYYFIYFEAHSLVIQPEKAEHRRFSIRELLIPWKEDESSANSNFNRNFSSKLRSAPHASISMQEVQEKDHDSGWFEDHCNLWEQIDTVASKKDESAVIETHIVDWNYKRYLMSDASDGELESSNSKTSEYLRKYEREDEEYERGNASGGSETEGKEGDDEPTSNLERILEIRKSHLQEKRSKESPHVFKKNRNSLEAAGLYVSSNSESQSVPLSTKDA